MAAVPRHESFGRTDIGKLRRRNEDAILVRDDVGLWVVADGLGGHADGDVASRMIVERLAGLTFDSDRVEFVESIKETLTQVNRELRQLARARQTRVIASTVVLLIHCPEYMLCGWAGDSRAYAFVNDHLRQITCDHSEGDEYTARPAAGTAALTRAVGAAEELVIEWVMSPNTPGLRYLLCSDGINKEISDAELEAEFKRQDRPETLIEGMVELALQRGGRDNISAIAVQLEHASS